MCMPLGLIFAAVAQVTRVVTSKQGTTTEIVYLITNLSPTHAGPERLLDVIGGHWSIENGSPARPRCDLWRGSLSASLRRCASDYGDVAPSRDHVHPPDGFLTDCPDSQNVLLHPRSGSRPFVSLLASPTIIFRPGVTAHGVRPFNHH